MCRFKIGSSCCCFVMTRLTLCRPDDARRALQDARERVDTEDPDVDFVL